MRFFEKFRKIAGRRHQPEAFKILSFNGLEKLEEPEGSRMFQEAMAGSWKTPAGSGEGDGRLRKGLGGNSGLELKTLHGRPKS